MSVEDHSLPDLVIPDGLEFSNALPIPPGALFINLFGQPDVDAPGTILVNPFVQGAVGTIPAPAAPGTNGWVALVNVLDVAVTTPGQNEGKAVEDLGKLSGSFCLRAPIAAVIGDNTWKANATWSGALYG
jgi:hypothetical protein